tara:strand:- start:1129 stop:1353 length:225 start_codon:yes stop_codon:yes gene_type:complete
MQMITYFDQKAQLFYAILRKGGRVYMGYSCLSNEEGEPITHKEARRKARQYCEELVIEYEEKENAHGQSKRVVH